MKFGIEFSPERPTYEIAYHARLAEDAGFHHVWITDHYNNRNVWVTLSDIAHNTSRIFLGSGVINPYVCNPVWTASAIFTLDEISQGRAILGIGAGDRVTMDSMGIGRKRPIVAVREAIEIFRTLNEKRHVRYEGENFFVNDARIKMKPRKNIPVYIGAQGPKMLELAARMADGVLINASHPLDFAPSVERLKNGVASWGRRMGDIDIAAYTSFSIDEKREKAVRKARIVAGAIAAGAPVAFNERHGITEREACAMRDMFQNQRYEEMKEKVGDHVVEAYSIAGTPEDCVEKIKRLSGAGVSQIVCGMPLGKSKADAIKLIREEVLPHFK